MTLDPIILQIVPNLPAVSRIIDYPAMREQTGKLISMLNGPDGPVPVASIEARTIPGPSGQMPLRIFHPRTAVTGILHFIHGGGWALGNLDSIEPVARRLARDLSMVVVTNTYRLAPEHPFPAGFEDCVAAARWTLDHAAELAGDHLPVVLGGESAGGNLAAAVALWLVKEGLAGFDAQLLFYPATDLRPEAPATYPSRAADADPFLRTEAVRTMVADYLAGQDAADPRVSPIAAADLAGCPPAVIAVVSVDPLRDEAIAYAGRLRDAGVRVETLEFDDLVHGFPGLAGLVPSAAEATAKVAEALNAMLRAGDTG